MEEFLGVLFCGGKGERLGEITKYISKSFIPVYDKPVFKFGLELLCKSGYINEIVFLTNSLNDEQLKNEGYPTIIQDDSKVNDMFTGWSYIKNITGTKKNGVLFPSDNICNVNIDYLIENFIKHKYDFLFSLHKISDKKKISEMGSFNVSQKKYSYKNPVSDLGVIAPYIIKNSVNTESEENIFESNTSSFLIHEGYWFDLGDKESIIDACDWRKKNPTV